MKHIIDYDFKAVTHEDYELVFIMRANTRMFNFIFNKARAKLANKGVKVKGTPAQFKKIEVPEQYFKLIKTIVTKQIKQVSKEVKQDNIIICSANVIKSYFEKNLKNNEWIINIKIFGSYVDKR